MQKAVEHVETVVAHLRPDDWMTWGGVWCQRRRTIIQFLLLRPTTTTGRHLSSTTQHAPASLFDLWPVPVSDSPSRKFHIHIGIQ